METGEFFAAIRHGDIEAVIAHLEAHPDQLELRNPRAKEPNSSEWDEIAPIHCAAKSGRLEIVRMLVGRGAEVYSHPLATYPAVMLAAWEGHQDIVDYFLNEIPDKAEGTLQLGITCNLAARQGWIDVVRAHLERDPLAVHQRGWIGDTPLHWPAHNVYEEIVRLLLDHGADPNVHEINWIGGTPLHWASERHAKIVRMLIEAGARVNEQVNRPGSGLLGSTPLIWCSRQRDDAGDVVTDLLGAGADLSIKDADGKTAEDHARERGNRRILAALGASQ